MEKEQRESVLNIECIPKLEQTLDKDVPLYVQIYDILYELIRNGTAQPGSVLPGENALVSYFGISRGTIRQAIRYLEEEGLVIKRQGCGSVVTKCPESQAGLQRYSDVCQEYCTVPLTDVDIQLGYTGAGTWLSQQMQIFKGALMLSAEITYRSDNEIVALSQRLIPASLLERFSVDAGDEAALKRFAMEGLSQLIARTQAVILIKTDDIPEALVGYDVPILSVTEIAHDIQSSPVCHFKSYLRNDCFQLHVTRMQRIR